MKTSINKSKHDRDLLLNDVLPVAICSAECISCLTGAAVAAKATVNK